ncbi:hypothetical protein ACQ86O_03535 [Serratia sp. L9]|uniref:hypothetical protein n=1 Tax=Serratia sp. L9 TaxID=3423946 RepID=UPI003D670619
MNGGNGGNGGNSGIKGADGTEYSAGTGSQGGNGGHGGNAGEAGGGLLTVEKSSLSIRSGMVLGGDGGNGGNGGNSHQAKGSAGNGGNASAGASGQLTFMSGHISNTGGLVLGGKGGNVGDNGTSAQGVGAKGGYSGNGGKGTAIFEQGYGQIATDIVLGGAGGDRPGEFDQTTQINQTGNGGQGHLAINGGQFYANTLQIGGASNGQQSSGRSAFATTLGGEGVFAQSGGTFSVDITTLGGHPASTTSQGTLKVSGGIFASDQLNAYNGLLDINGDNAAMLVGSTDMNEQHWQQARHWLAEDKAALFSGTLVAANGQTVDLSSGSLHWGIGGRRLINWARVLSRSLMPSHL